jgi:diguanylate cyclase (GGDEF)-like protein
LLYLAWRIRVLKVAVRTGKEKQAELTEINMLLDQRSRTLEEKSKLDPLTGAYNRAGMEDSLTTALRHWKYDKKPLSLLLFDVDHFKLINDTHGHTVGDNVLRELTLLVNSNIRSEDKFARWGGEEFIIVCGNTSLNQAVEIAEKLRNIVDACTLAGSLKVTVSFGVAQIREGESLEALFNRTDQALYAAKAQGRNQVKVAEK